mgnify:CR=1 FL=1
MERIRYLEWKAARCRRNVVRMVEASHHGHLGGALSCIDVVTALYFDKMKVDPKQPRMETRDRFLLSAGHKCMAQYAVLAERGYFPKEVLDTYGQLGSPLPGHPDMHKLPGIEANTGALGHGMSIAAGIALGCRSQGLPSNVYVVTGDGELPEGSNWEAASAASYYRLDHLTVFVDNNGLQISGGVRDVMDMSPIAGRFGAFGWATAEIDGNDMSQIVGVLDRLPLESGKPSLVLMHTVKGKGLSFAENQVSCHFWSPGEEELKRAVAETDAAVDRLEQEAGR